jgi:DNA-binding NarL/FixJ family response regulator
MMRLTSPAFLRRNSASLIWHAEHASAQLAARAMGGAAVSPREVEVLRLIAAGKSNKEIAGLLFISEGTVKTHIINILNTLGVRDRTGAVVAAIRRGILRL